MTSSSPLPAPPPPPPPSPPSFSLKEAAEAARVLGNAAFARGAWSVAAEHYQAASLGDPRDARPRANAAAALLQTGDARAALPFALEAAALEPSWPKAHWRVAEVAEASGDWEGAAKAYERAVELMTLTLTTKSTTTATTKSTSTAKTTATKSSSVLPFARERRVAEAVRLRADRERKIVGAASALDSRPRAREQTLVRVLRKERERRFFFLFLARRGGQGRTKKTLTKKPKKKNPKKARPRPDDLRDAAPIRAVDAFPGMGARGLRMEAGH